MLLESFSFEDEETYDYEIFSTLVITESSS